MRVHVNLARSRVSPEVRNLPTDRADSIVESLFTGNEAMTEWVTWPMKVSDEKLDEILRAADEISEIADALIVIGIGGSYVGTAAVLDAIGGPKDNRPEIYYAGQNLSGPYLKGIASLINTRECALCVISKSGTTMETCIAFEILKAAMEKRYGHEEAVRRIVCITDASEGKLRAEGEKEGYMMFDIPSGIGGRYSVLTAVGLFPLAVAGLDIKAMIRGAAEIANEKYWKLGGYKYALTRYALMNRGKEVEIFEYYDPALHNLGEWIKQLFGESEGKEGRGLLPMSLILPTDLHSLGQYLQEGRQIFFETVVSVLKYEDDVVIANGIGGKGLAGKSVNDISKIACKGVIEAHTKAEIPIVQINSDTNTEYSIGQLLYFFMMTAAVTGKLMRVDPFTQDGVEKYKAEIKKILEDEDRY